jgi:hypothetical protein
LVDLDDIQSLLGLKGLLGVHALVFALIGFVVMVNMSQLRNLEDETWGWINVSNEVGKVGAQIYPDTATPDLPSNLQFSYVYPPTRTHLISSLESFVTVIRNERYMVIYRHGDWLWIIRDPSFGYYYDPYWDDFGR